MLRIFGVNYMISASSQHHLPMPRVLGKYVSLPLRAYYRGPDHPMKLRIYRWFRKSVGYARFTIPYADFGLLTIDERDYLQEKIFATGFYEPEVWDILAGFAVRDEVVWDVGANPAKIS